MFTTALVRRVDARDHQQVSNLLFYESRLHRHLDWRSPLDWLGNPFVWAIEEAGRLNATMACPVEVEGVAWIRFFVHDAAWSAANAWGTLWATAREEIAQTGGATVAAIAMQGWFQSVLAGCGFETRQLIVLLEWKYQPWDRREAAGFRIRAMREDDVSAVEIIDAAAFIPLWQNPAGALHRALKQSLIATVIEDDSGVVAYQLTTGGNGRAHLARLAVHPAVQGHGLGSWLVNDLFGRLSLFGIGRLSVNTQSDNAASLALYQKLGFVRTGEQYPVFVYEVV